MARRVAPRGRAWVALILVSFVLVAASVIRLRDSLPEMARPFRTPLVPLLPVATILSSAALILFADRMAIFGFVCLLIAGALGFTHYRKRRAKTIAH